MHYMEFSSYFQYAAGFSLSPLFSRKKMAGQTTRRYFQYSKLLPQSQLIRRHFAQNLRFASSRVVYFVQHPILQKPTP